MPAISNLASRIDAEFSAVEGKIKKFQSEQEHLHKDRHKRLEQLGRAFDQLREVWKPRLELLAKKFEGKVQATPRITPSSREATFEFQSKLARVRLKLSAFTDRDIRKVILGYDLEIIPVLMQFDGHKQLEFPLDAVDAGAAAEWMDDRIVDFVRTYFSMGENEVYLRDYMVDDPIAQVRFPKHAAATTLTWNGKEFYFVSDETRREFEKQQGIASR